MTNTPSNGRPSDGAPSKGTPSSGRPSSGQASGDGPTVVLPEIPGYKLTRVLGEGGMSTVYLATQEGLGREVAIKVMRPEALSDEVSRRRFENEARTIARLEHPHIVGIFEVGRTADGLPYYAMPCLARGHLGQRTFAQDEAGQAQVRSILEQLLSALEYAHARGVIHRDVKAENVLFDEAERPLLADFGIALRRGYGPRVTGVGMAVGSTAYMAPEQARGEQVDARADLYAVGVLAYEMLTGQLPFVAGDALSMAVMHAQDPVPRLPRSLRHWQRFIDRALSKGPGLRFGSALEMRAALDRVPLQRRNAFGGAASRVAAGARALPRAAWIGVLLVAAAGIGIGYRQMQRPDNDFFRVAGDGGAGDSDAGASGQPVDAAEGMLRPIPVSPAERHIAAAMAQLQAHRLTSPADDNAYDSLMAGWRADPSNQSLPEATSRLLDALASAAADRAAAGADTRAAEYVRRAKELAAVARQADDPALAQMQDGLAKAYRRRVDAAVADLDQAAAQRALAGARAVIADAGTLSALQARAEAVPEPGDKLQNSPGMRVVHSGDAMVGLSTLKVSRADYARFAAATNRPASLCRQRASVLRIFKPISWKEPGFDQSASQPVVCVSWSDANAYANWLGRREGRTYRLPSGAEARQLGTGDGARPVSEWLKDCGPGCRERIASGHSWRDENGTRPLDPTRGYDDVGFRLVREL